MTLNAAVDQTYTVEGFAVNRGNRVSRVTAVPGGKEVNVARMAGILLAESDHDGHRIYWRYRRAVYP